MQSFTVTYSFHTASGEVAHHSKQSGPASSADAAVDVVLRCTPQFVRDNLVSASASVNVLNCNGYLIRRQAAESTN